MTNRIDLDFIECLLVVANTGSITTAAELHFMSQPALSRKILQLEKELNVQIFDRNCKPLQLTRAGRLYLDGCMKMMAAHKALETEMQELTRAGVVTIRLGLSMSISRRIAHWIIPKFRSMFPSVKVELIEKPSHELEKMVFQNQVDVAIVHHTSYPALRYQYITDVPLYLAVPRFYSEEHGLTAGVNKHALNLKELRNYPFILIKENHSIRKTVDMIFHQCGFAPNICFETDSVEVSNNLVNANMGFAFIFPPFLTLSKESVYCPIANYDIVRPLQLCMREELYCPPAMNVLMDILCEAINRYICLSSDFIND